jgi:hypothetical protein
MSRWSLVACFSCLVLVLAGCPTSSPPAAPLGNGDDDPMHDAGIKGGGSGAMSDGGTAGDGDQDPPATTGDGTDGPPPADGTDGTTDGTDGTTDGTDGTTDGTDGTTDGTDGTTDGTDGTTDGTDGTDGSDGSDGTGDQCTGTTDPVPPSADCSDLSGSGEGYVFNLLDGTPIVNAVVMEPCGNATVTDGDGHFIIALSPADQDIFYRITADGFENGLSMIFSSAQVSTVNAWLVPLGSVDAYRQACLDEAVLAFQTYDSVAQAPVADVTVDTSDASGHTSYADALLTADENAAQTSGDGFALITQLTAPDIKGLNIFKASCTPQNDFFFPFERGSVTAAKLLLDCP